jgi:hypothetical protein
MDTGHAYASQRAILFLLNPLCLPWFVIILKNGDCPIQYVRLREGIIPIIHYHNCYYQLFYITNQY